MPNAFAEKAGGETGKESYRVCITEQPLTATAVKRAASTG